MFIESKALEIANKLEINGEGCECYARSRSDCSCPDAIWAEDFIIEAAKELRRLYHINKTNSQIISSSINLLEELVVSLDKIESLSSSESYVVKKALPVIKKLSEKYE